jgi:hypothetical protein
MLTGTCLCGASGWQLIGPHEGNAATVCNCAACRRFGGVWSYGWLGETVIPTGAATRGFVRSDIDDAGLAFHTCMTCGSLMTWQGLAPDENGRTRAAVNLRQCDDPEAVRDLALRLFDGRDSWSKDKTGRMPHRTDDLWF